MQGNPGSEEGWKANRRGLPGQVPGRTDFRTLLKRASSSVYRMQECHVPGHVARRTMRPLSHGRWSWFQYVHALLLFRKIVRSGWHAAIDAYYLMRRRSSRALSRRASANATRDSCSRSWGAPASAQSPAAAAPERETIRPPEDAPSTHLRWIADALAFSSTFCVMSYLRYFNWSIWPLFEHPSLEATHVAANSLKSRQSRKT